jgi:peroxiredoxin
MMKLLIAMLLMGAGFQPAPPHFELKDIQGNAHNLAEYHGKVVVLNFWATWCIPCKSEMPIFVEAYTKYHDRGVVVLAASVDEDNTRKYIAQYAHAYKMEFPILINVNTDIMRDLGLGEAVPSTVFFDPDGNVAGKILGQAKKKDVMHRIEWLLGNREGQPPAAVTDTISKK